MFEACKDLPTQSRLREGRGPEIIACWNAWRRLNRPGVTKIKVGLINTLWQDNEDR